jgi:hypothetical protein
VRRVSRSQRKAPEKWQGPPRLTGDGAPTFGKPLIFNLESKKDQKYKHVHVLRPGIEPGTFSASIIGGNPTM